MSPRLPQINARKALPFIELFVSFAEAAVAEAVDAFFTFDSAKEEKLK